MSCQLSMENGKWELLIFSYDNFELLRRNRKKFSTQSLFYLTCVLGPRKWCVYGSISLDPKLFFHNPFPYEDQLWHYNNHCQNNWSKVKKSSKIRLDNKILIICLWAIYDHYCQKILYSGETGHLAVSLPSEIFLIFPNLCS